MPTLEPDTFITLLMLAVPAVLIVVALRATLAATPNGRTPPYHGPYRVLRIIDGDTYVLQFGRFGPRFGSRPVTERVRTLGADSPESVHPDRPKERFSDEASELARRLLEGRRVYLAYDIERRDGYGRLLAAVYVPHSKGSHTIRGRRYILMSEELFLAGLARPQFIGQNRAYKPLLTQAYRLARNRRTGMWAGRQR